MPTEDSESSWIKIVKSTSGYPEGIEVRIDGKFGRIPKEMSKEDVAKVLDLDNKYIHIKLQWSG